MRNNDPFDTYLLRVLCILIAERSVSRTAVRLNQSQPAISSALKRLRVIFGDPLMTREKNEMVPTERALQIVQNAQAALHALENLLNRDEQFDSQTCDRTFTIAMPDYFAPSFVASIVRRFREEAPCSKLVIQPMRPDYDYERALAEGLVDIVVGNWPNPPEHLHLSILIKDEVVCLMSDDHPLARPGKLTRESYMNGAHIVPLPYSNSQRSFVESGLASLRLTRSKEVSCPYFSLAPYLVNESDLILTTARHFAAYYARRLPLAIIPFPFPFPLMQFYLLWHPSRHRSVSHAWLRGVLTDEAHVLKATAAQAD